MQRRTVVWTFAISSLALFMVVLDNLVVTAALTTIRADLGACLEQLEWTVNAYTLTYAVLLISGAALGDRFGRRRISSSGSRCSPRIGGRALAPDIGTLIAARAIQGVGGAIVMPLSITMLAEAVRAEQARRRARRLVGGHRHRRRAARWSAARCRRLSWQWIFWINVPIGLTRSRWSRPSSARAWARASRSTSPGLGPDQPRPTRPRLGRRPWPSGRLVEPRDRLALGFGAALFVAFLLGAVGRRRWSRSNSSGTARSPRPTSAALMYFGSFGAVFLLIQYLQVAGYSPLQAGLRCLPWTLAPMFVAPVIGAMSDKHGGGRYMVIGLALQAIGLAWLGLELSVDAPFSALLGGLVVSGIGNGFFFAPVANVVLGAVPLEDEGKASGINNALRELGGVFGIAVLASVFSHYGSFASPQDYVDGLLPAVWIGAAVIAVAAISALWIGKGETRYHTHEPAPARTPELAMAD